MRLLFALLLLVNAGYFVWEFHFAAQLTAEPVPATARTPQDVEQLVLLSERPELLNQTAPPNNRAIAAAPAAARQCFEIGPIAETSSLAALTAELEKLGLRVERRLTERRDAEGYWVYLPALSSQREAQEKLKEMQEKGLSDLFVMERGEQRNAISLGLFERLSTARTRMDELRKMGYQPQMELQYQSRAEVLLDAEIPPGNADLRRQLETVMHSHDGLAYRSRECA